MLAHNVIDPENAEPSGYLFFVHGILGTRANWRGIARRFVEQRPDWGAVLVDLREHGESLGRPAPHTVRTAAADLLELEVGLGLPIGGALGHSFGGKVVLDWLGQRARAAEVWLIDSAPGPSATDVGTDTTATVLATLGALPADWPSRQAFVDALVGRGQPQGIAQWLAMNLKRGRDGGRVFGPDLSVIRSLVEDYATIDLWPIVESPPEGTILHEVIGGRSAVFSAGERTRMQALAAQRDDLFVHVFEAAGHWIHVDAPDALVALLTSTVHAQP